MYVRIPWSYVLFPRNSKENTELISLYDIVILKRDAKMIHPENFKSE